VPPGPRHGWYVVACAFLVALAGWGFGFYGPAVYLAALNAERGWSAMGISTAVTAYYVVGAALITGVGGAMYRFGARPVVATGVLAMAAGVAGLAFAAEPWQIYPPFLLMALGWTAMSGAAVNTMVAGWFVGRSGMAISLAMNGASFGGIVVAPALVLLIQAIGFERALPLAAGIMLAVLLPVVLAVLGPRPPPAPRPAGAGWSLGRALADRNFLTIALAFSLVLAAQVGFLTHQIAYLAPALGLEAAGWAVSLTTGIAVVGRVATGFVIDRLDGRKVACGNFLVQFVALAVLLRAEDAAGLYLGCALYGLVLGNVASLPGLLLVREVPAEHFGRAVSLLLAIGQLVYAFGPAIVGGLAAWRGSYDAALVACMAADLVAAVVILVRRR